MAEAPGAGAGLASGLRLYVRDVTATVGRRRLTACAALVLVSTLLDGVGLLMLVPLLQLVGGSAATPALQWLLRHGVQPRLAEVLLLFVGVVLARAAVTRWREAALLGLRLDYVDALRRRLELALATAPWQRLAQIPHATVLHLLTDQLARINLGTAQLLQLLSGVGLGAAGIAVAGIVSPRWTLAVLLPLAVLTWALGGRLVSAAALGHSLSRGQRASLSSARDFLAGLKLVKAHGAEQRYLAEFDHRAALLRDEQLRYGRHQAVTRGSFEAAGALLLAALLYGAATWGRLGLPELLLIVLVFSRLLPLVREGHLQLQQLAHMAPAYLDVQELIARCGGPPAPQNLRPRAGALRPPPAGDVQAGPATMAHGHSRADALLRAPPAGVKATWGGPALPPDDPVHPLPLTPPLPDPLPLQRELQLIEVGFRYPAAQRDALGPLTLTLPAGSTTALTGPSGAGKTTLADVAAGLLPATTGTVLVDGLPLDDDATLQRWRRSVAYVGQDAFLFTGPVRDNLCWLAGPRPDAELWQALAQADAAGFVAALGGGLDHRLGERGEGLSGGERQRLALARALLGRPSLLILDEITSQLDAASEERVLSALDRLRGRTTMLMIAHRAAVRGHADRVVVLAQGRVQTGAASAAEGGAAAPAAVAGG